MINLQLIFHFLIDCLPLSTKHIMITPTRLRAIAFLLLLSSLTGTAKPTPAQPITPAADGTGTIVTPEGQQFNIEGGQLSQDGANLFHSFEQFGLDAGQVANFLSNPDIHNILGRITGGDASIINGLIQLTGGNSNLYLMNPAGILFGPNVQLNVPADFFATTATGMGFSEGNWFHAVGDTTWSNLVGTPAHFAFSPLQPGAIVNQGNLTLEPGQNLTLLGGTLLNTGTLSAPGGNITLSAVPGESVVRISQENHLLSLDIRTGISGLELPTPQSLPELLTGSGVTHANQVTVNPDGSIQLSSSGISIDTQTGDNIAAGTLTTSQGQIALLGNRVATIDADINASGTNGGGTVLIGGDYQGNASIPNAVQTLISPNTTIHADAIERGDGGRVIIWADETTQFFGNISAKGGPEFGDGGFVEVSGLEFLQYQGQVDTFAPNGNLGTLLLDPTNIEVVAEGEGDTTDLNDVNAFDTPDSGNRGTTLDVTAINEATANVILQATQDITFSAAINNPNLGVGLRAEAGNDIRVNADITLNQGNLDLIADGGIAITNATINTGGGNFTATGTGSATLHNGISLDTGVINAGGGNINLTGRGLDDIDGSNNSGIWLGNGTRVETTGNGIITLEGTGGKGTDSNTGIFASTQTTVSANGDITLTGTGGEGTGEFNRGVELQDGIVESTAGAVSITGTGGTGTNSNLGMFVENTTVSGNGDITLTGIGANSTGQQNRGAELQDGTVESTGGEVSITGTGGRGTDENSGIFVSNTTVFGNGNLTLTGTGGDGTGERNRGVTLQDGIVESTGGAVSITGTAGRGTDENTGIFISNTTVFGNVNINLTGTGGDGTGERNRGVTLQNGLVESTGGAVAITGMGGTGTNQNTGIFVSDASVFGNGNITLTGTGSDSTGQLNRGVTLQGGSWVESTGGAVAITGIGGTGTNQNSGIFGSNATVFGNGDITLNGTGGDGTGEFNGGVALHNGSVVESIGGAVTITGTGSNGTNGNIGIVVGTDANNTETNTRIQSENGTITLIGIGNGSGEMNLGILLETILNHTEPGNVIPVSNIESTGTGTIILEGMGANGVEGIRLENSFINYMGTGSGDVMLRSNDIRLTGETRISTNGTLTLEPIAPGGDISINNTTAEFNLTTEELLMLDVNRGDFILGSETIGNIYLGSLDENIDIRDANYNLTLKTNQGIYVYGGMITNTQNLTLEGGVNLLNPVTLTTDSGDITLTRTIDGNANLTLNSGTGNIAIEGAVGSQTELGNLTILNAHNVTTESITAASLTQVAGTGSTIFNGEILTTGANGINVTTNQITFNAPTTTTGGGGVTLDNAEILEIAAPFNLEGAFQQTGLGSVILNSEITTHPHNIELTAPVTLTGEASLNPGTGSLVFGSSLDALNHPLTLTAGQMEFNGPVTGSNTLTLQPATTSQNMTLGNIDKRGSLNLTGTELEYINGFSAITLGRPDSSGTIFTGDSLTFKTPVILEAGSGIIAVNGTIMGSENASLALNAATIELNSDIITDHNDIALTGNVILGNDINLNTNSAGGDITVVGNIDSNSGNPTRPNLTLNAGTGAINLLGNVGETTPLQTVTGTSNRGTLHGNVTTDGGDITLNGAIALAEALKLSTGEGGGNITFAGTLDSETNLGQNLTLSAGTGTMTFNGAIGSLQPLGNLDILNAGTITGLEAISAASFRALSSGTITLDGNLTTTEAPGVEIQSVNQLTVADITTNGQALSLESQTANVTTGNLETSSATTGGTITVTSTQGEITTGNLTASGVNQGGDITIIAEIAITAEEIDSSATLGDGGNVFIDPIGDIQVSWINAQGGTDGSGGEVFIETTGGFFRAMRSFASEYSPTGFASISTAGGTGGGSITLKHEGGDLGGLIQEFEIGNPELNGTADVILTGTSILEMGEVFPRSVTRGNITIKTDDAIPDPTPTQTPTTPENPILPETLPEEPALTPTPGSEPTPPELVSEEPLSTPEPRVTEEISQELGVTEEIPQEPDVTEEIPQEPAVNDSLPQPEPVQPPRITPAPGMAPEPILPGSPSPSLSPLSSPTEPEPVVSATLPMVTTPDPEPTPVVLEPIQVSTIGSTLSRVEVSDRSNEPLEEAIASVKVDSQIRAMEEAFSREFMDYLDYPDDSLELLSVEDIQKVLRDTEDITEVKTAAIYVSFARTQLNENSALLCPSGAILEEERGDRTEEQELDVHCAPQAEDPLEVFIVTGVDEPLRFQIPEASRELVEQLALDLRTQVTDVRRQFTDSYLATAQALHHLLIEPMEAALKERGIQNLVFIPDAGVRSIPFAALHNGENFLIEDYSLALVPSFSLTQPRYRNLTNERVLGMGASKFDRLPPLPAVAVELNTIVCTNQINQNNCWPGEVFLNEAFTLDTLKERGTSGDFRIIHLATHADFQSGNPENSYIQLWDQRVKFSQIKELQWVDPEVELLVLSSCRTAVGDLQSELGFAGLALQSGVKSAIASLWYVNDEATFGLMSEFYRELRSAPIRSEGLRRAQVEMLRGNVRFEGGKLVGSNQAIALPKELEHLNGMNLSHPYYWAGFITIGSPW